jgi:hypothetical protein
VSCDVGNIFVSIVNLCLERILRDVGMYFMGIYLCLMFISAS